ncbi:hypothetical protein JW968_00140 [Candidatus Woesearchaeota archaeon]|nr:hypothetical protein [Candidatus Woesearchaeota archaeon]
MGITTKVKRILAGTLLAAGLYAGAARAEEAGTQSGHAGFISQGYNAVEMAVTDQQFRTRLLTNIDASIEGMQVGIHGMNETNDLSKDGYFGRNVLTAGKKGAGTSLAYVLLTNSNGIVDQKIGIRNTSILKKLGCYGSVDAAVDADGGNMTVFVGKPLPGGMSAEMYHSAEMPFSGDPNHYTEAQLNKDLGKNMSGFVRAEIPDLKLDDAAYLGGVTVRF